MRNAAVVLLLVALACLQVAAPSWPLQAYDEALYLVVIKIRNFDTDATYSVEIVPVGGGEVKISQTLRAIPWVAVYVPKGEYYITIMEMRDKPRVKKVEEVLLKEGMAKLTVTYNELRFAVLKVLINHDTEMEVKLKSIDEEPEKNLTLRVRLVDKEKVSEVLEEVKKRIDIMSDKVASLCGLKTLNLTVHTSSEGEVMIMCTTSNGTLMVELEPELILHIQGLGYYAQLTANATPLFTEEEMEFEIKVPVMELKALAYIQWKPRFSSPRFDKSSRSLLGVLEKILASLSLLHVVASYDSKIIKPSDNVIVLSLKPIISMRKVVSLPPSSLEVPVRAELSHERLREANVELGLERLSPISSPRAEAAAFSELPRRTLNALIAIAVAVMAGLISYLVLTRRIRWSS